MKQLTVKRIAYAFRCILGAALVIFAGQASAAAIIYNTGDATTATIAMGVNDEGHLNVVAGNITSNAGATGIATKFADGSWRDATSPGCLCEGWGVAADGIGAGVNEFYGGASGIAVDSFASTSSTATSLTHMTALPDLTVEHNYMPSASSSLFEAVVTISNTSLAAMTDVRYTRAMDWDIPPTEFSEFVTIGGTATTTDLLYSSDNGFVDTNPFAARDPFIGADGAGCGITTDFEDCGAADHGAVFDFGFGDLAAGETKTFSIFYGAAIDETGALAALGEVGAELFSFGQSNTSDGASLGTPATFIFAFRGVGGEVVVPPPSDVPEPGSLVLLSLGLLGLGWSRNRSQKI